MDRRKIKIYSPDSSLSKIADEVIDEGKPTYILIEIRDDIPLISSCIYSVQIKRDSLHRGNFQFKYNNLNLIKIDVNGTQEKDLLSTVARSPYEIKLFDLNNNLLGVGQFYRYRSDQSKRSTNPKQWNPNYNPLAHKNYTSSTYKPVTTPSKSYTSSLYPTPDRSSSNISMPSLASLKYSPTTTPSKQSGLITPSDSLTSLPRFSLKNSSITSSTLSQIKHSTPSPSQVSTAQRNYNLYVENGFFNKERKFFKHEDLLEENSFKSQHSNNLDCVTDDSSSDDEQYSCFRRTNLTKQFETMSQVSINTETRLEIFDSIESISEINYSLKSTTKFHSFSLKFTTYNTDPNYSQIGKFMYVGEADKIFVSNHAIRTLEKEYNIKNVASFKIDFQIIDTKRAQECEDELIFYLKTGIPINIQGREQKFFFIGNSNSGMRERNFWAIDQESFNRIDFDSFLNRMGNFEGFSIQKLSKRFSQFFSATRPSITLRRDEYVCIEDEMSDLELCYTDGIGLIRLKTCEKISQLLNLKYTSNIFQVRCGGFKGMLVGFSDELFDSILAENHIRARPDIKVIFRKSQKKFDSNSLELNIVSWSSYDSTPASLNSEFLMVLDGLSGPEFKNYILKLFKNYLDEIEESLTDSKKAYAKLFASSELTEFSYKFGMILLACKRDLSQELDPKQYKIIREFIIENNLFNLISKRRISIPIEKSRYLIGVLDETGLLEEDEIFVSFRNQYGKVEFLNEQHCIVGRTPCYGLTEIRRVKTRYIPQLEHLENCVIFSKKGDRPLINLLSGGDLDGDFYFVSWDEVLTRIENSNKFINYPKNDEEFDTVRMRGLRLQLAEFYAKEVFAPDQIGLWHYYLTSMYDLDRNNMNKKEYLKGVIEINKCIDGVNSQVKRPAFVIKPDWYLTTNDLACLDYLAKKEEKFVKLVEILKQKNFNFDLVEQDSDRFSILCCMANMGIKKFIDLIEKSDQKFSGQFLSGEEVSLLERDEIIALDLCSEKIHKRNIAFIKREYMRYVEEVKRLEARIKSNSGREIKMFTGLYERNVRSDSGSKKEILKAKLLENFRNYVKNLEYFEEPVTDKNLERSINSYSGLFFKSRVLSLYLELRDDDRNYQIPWVFYDVLCDLKNYCSNKRSARVSAIFPKMVPFTLSAECTKLFSPNKLSNFYKI